MIPEAAGATPYGIFLLADDYLKAAKGLQTIAAGHPVRLLAYHAAELFLKTYMRSAGETVAALRAQNHDLLEMVARAEELGLKLPPQIGAQAREMADKNDYVRIRYVVTEQRSDIPLDKLLRFVETIRGCVIVGPDVDDEGVPRGRAWLGHLPSDYSVHRQ